MQSGSPLQNPLNHSRLDHPINCYHPHYPPRPRLLFTNKNYISSSEILTTISKTLRLVCHNLLTADIFEWVLYPDWLRNKACMPQQLCWITFFKWNHALQSFIVCGCTYGDTMIIAKKWFRGWKIESGGEANKTAFLCVDSRHLIMIPFQSHEH